MRSLISRKERKNGSEVNEGNKRAIFFGCCGMCSGCWASDSPRAQTSLSFVSTNGSTSNTLNENKLAGEPDNGPVYVERYHLIKDEFQSSNLKFATLSCSRSLLSWSILPSMAEFTSLSIQSFEATPLTQVLPQLYVGNEQDAQEAEKLIGLGITHVISIVGGGRYKDLYPKHMYIPLRDNGSSNLLEKIDNSWDFVMESQEPGNKLFVHCQLGQNRSASFVIGFLMKFRNLSLYEAYAFLKEKRELIHPHKKYLEQLRQLDLELHKVYSTPRNFLDIALCSKEEIKIMHHNFSKADSKKYMRTQMPNWNEDDDSLGSQSILRVRNGDDAELVAIYLPD